MDSTHKPRAGKKDQASSVLDIEALARRLSPAGDASRLEDQWDQWQIEACMALVNAALRLGSNERLELAIKAFGGLPPVGKKTAWNAGGVLSRAAENPAAFGFERLLAEQQMQAEGGDNFASIRVLSSELGAEGLGGWLRTGLFNSYYQYGSAKFDSGKAREVESIPKPVAVCFARDNPMALAKILGDPARFDALRAMEPKPMEEPLEWAKLSSYSERDELLDKGRKADAGFEKSLLWQALAMGALRCAGLLSAIPEFSTPLLKSPGFGALSDSRYWFERPKNTVFEEPGEASFYLFEWALHIALSADSRKVADRDEFKRAARAMIESMVESADEANKSFEQPGTGMGWPEMYFVEASPHRWGRSAEGGNEFAQEAIADAMRMLNLFESNGFKPQWRAMAEASGECRVLKEWLELKAESAIDAEAGQTSGMPRRKAL